MEFASRNVTRSGEMTLFQHKPRTNFGATAAAATNHHTNNIFVQRNIRLGCYDNKDITASAINNAYTRDAVGGVTNHQHRLGGTMETSLSYWNHVFSQQNHRQQNPHHHQQPPYIGGGAGGGLDEHYVRFSHTGPRRQLVLQPTVHKFAVQPHSQHQYRQQCHPHPQQAPAPFATMKLCTLVNETISTHKHKPTGHPPTSSVLHNGGGDDSRTTSGGGINRHKHFHKTLSPIQNSPLYLCTAAPPATQQHAKKLMAVEATNTVGLQLNVVDDGGTAGINGDTAPIRHNSSKENDDGDDEPPPPLPRKNMLGFNNSQAMESIATKNPAKGRQQLDEEREQNDGIDNDEEDTLIFPIEL